MRRPPGFAPGVFVSRSVLHVVQAFFVSQKISAISSILASSSSAPRRPARPLVPRGAGQLGGLVDELVQLRVLLEVRGLEVVGPQHPQVVLDQLGALLLDQDRAGAEVGVVVVGDLGDDGLDRLGLDAGLGGVVDAAGQVAVGGDLDGGGEESANMRRVLSWSRWSSWQSTATLLRVTPRHGARRPGEVASCAGAGSRCAGRRWRPTLRDGDRLLVRYGARGAAGAVRVLVRFADGTARGQAGRRAPDDPHRRPRLVAAQRQRRGGRGLAAPRGAARRRRARRRAPAACGRPVAGRSPEAATALCQD